MKTVRSPTKTVQTPSKANDDDMVTQKTPSQQSQGDTQGQNTHDTEIDNLVDELENYNPEIKGRPTNAQIMAQFDIMTRAMNTFASEIKGMRSEVATKKEIIDLKSEVAESTKISKEVFNRLQQLEGENGKLKENITILETENTKMKKNIVELKEQVNLVIDMCEDLEQNDLASKLILKCNAPSSNEAPARDEVKKFLGDTLLLTEDQMRQINLKKMPRSENIYCISLDSISLKGHLFKKCKELSPENFYLSEFLTKKKHKLMYDLRKLKSNDSTIERIYSFNGRIFVKKTNVNDPILVRNVSDCYQ